MNENSLRKSTISIRIANKYSPPSSSSAINKLNQREKEQMIQLWLLAFASFGGFLESNSIRPKGNNNSLNFHIPKDMGKKERKRKEQPLQKDPKLHN